MASRSRSRYFGGVSHPARAPPESQAACGYQKLVRLDFYDILAVSEAGLMSHARVYKIRGGTKQTSFVSLTMPFEVLYADEVLYAELFIQQGGSL